MTSPNSSLICRGLDDCFCAECSTRSAQGCNTREKCLALSSHNTWALNVNECLLCSADNPKDCSTKEDCLATSPSHRWVCQSRGDYGYNAMECSCKRCTLDDPSGCQTEEDCRALSSDFTLSCDRGRNGPQGSCRCLRCTRNDTRGCDTKAKCMHASPYFHFDCADDDLYGCSYGTCQVCSFDELYGCVSKEKCEGASPHLSWYCHEHQGRHCMCRRCTEEHMSYCSTRERCLGTGPAAVWYFNKLEHAYRCGHCGDGPYDGYVKDGCTCTTAVCNALNSNGLAGPACACADGFEGGITWEGHVPKGNCTPKACNIANSNFEPGTACACKWPLFSGSITWQGPLVTGGCSLDHKNTLGVLGAFLLLCLFLFLCQGTGRCHRQLRKGIAVGSEREIEFSTQLLAEAGLQEHIPTFEAEGITLDAMRAMTEEEFQQLGLKKGPRVLLRQALERAP